VPSTASARWNAARAGSGARGESTSPRACAARAAGSGGSPPDGAAGPRLRRSRGGPPYSRRHVGARLRSRRGQAAIAAGAPVGPP
jgi:hypothetical protein